MKSIQEIESKIESLKQKRESLRIKAADMLFKKLEKTLGADFSPELVLGMVSASYKNSSKSQKEDWVKSGSTFLKKSSK